MKMKTDEAIRTREKYLCARCWSALIARPDPHQVNVSNVVCSNENCNGEGFVTKTFVQERREREAREYLEAKANLASIFEPDKKRRTESDIMKDLGFEE